MRRAKRPFPCDTPPPRGWGRTLLLGTSGVADSRGKIKLADRKETVDARLSALVCPPPRAHPALSPLQDPSGLDAGLPGGAVRARGDRHLWDRAHPPHPGGSEPPADRPERAL